MWRSEQRFQGLFEDAPIGIATLDLDGRITECNHAFGAMAPAGPPGPLGMPLAGLVAEDDRAELASRLSGATAGTAAAAPFDVRLRGEGEGERGRPVVQPTSGGQLLLNAGACACDAVDESGELVLEEVVDPIMGRSNAGR